ncbi:serine racemase isoform X1 [Vombatus ursinus]|nr:serine racemase isoform X1 [Vombatus ursinus]XP_027718362.1 serine racemase isoform X1 [Vombatus ursinus]XP_027718363.1 serine racemase isoform X1 [Vombatus ursinus]XP_027718364.1 serine racemase isoform X1 [Vombatus ursinus]
MCSQYCISLADVKKAHSNIEDLVHITPILTSSILNQLAGRKLFFKCELFQKTGSFKALASKDKPVEQSLISRSFPCVTIRGALNAIQGLTFSPSDGKKPKAVVTHSSGNHGQALSYAAKLKGIPAYIVVPRTAPSCKKSAIQGYGATIIDCEPSDESRTTVAARIVKQTEGTMVHPNQCPAVMAGQGTIALEVLEQVPAVDALVVPVGGGGMISGIAVTVKALRPEVKVYAAEPCNADDCFQSKLKGELTPNPSPPVTIADGVKSSIGPNTWPIIRDLVDEVFTVTEDEIKHATQLVWERMKLLIEPTAAVGVAAVLGERFRKVVPAAQAICVVLSGGNVDLTSLRWLKQPEGEEAQRPQN